MLKEVAYPDVKILLIEDNPGDIRIIKELLQDAVDFKFDLISVDNLLDGLNYLEEKKVDVILLDLALPDSTGFDTVLRTREKAKNVPIVVLTGLNDGELALKAIHAGAQDFLVKGQIDTNPLVRSINHAIERHKMTQTIESIAKTLQDNEERLKKIIDLNADGIIIVDMEGKVCFVNPAAEKLFERKSEEFRGQFFGFSTGKKENLEIEIIQKGENLVYAEMNIAKINWEGKDAQLITLRDMTYRKKAEKAIQQSEDRIRTLLDSLNTGVILVNEESHKIVEMNPAALKMIGAHNDQVINKICHQFICPLVKGQCPISDLGQTVDTAEHILITIKGQYVPILKTSTLVKLNGIEYILESFIDITEKKKAEEALRRSEERYRDLYEEAPNAYFSIGIDRSILHSNMAASKLLGYTKEEFLNMDVFNLYHDSEDGLGKAKTTFQQFLRGEKFVDKEVIMRHKNGSPIWISLSVSPIKDQNDQIIQSCSIAVDITDRKKAEEKIKYQAKLVDSISDAIISTDLDFNILSWNKAAENIYGWKSDDVIGELVADILKTEYINQDRNKILKIIHKKGHWSGEVIQQRKSHQKVNVFSTLSIIRDIKENPIGVVAINRDVTELRKSKQEVIKLERTLHKMNALIETAPLAIFLFNPSGKILRANEEAKNLFKYNDEILNFKILDLFDSDYVKLAKKHFDYDIYNLSVPNKFEASIKSKTGKIIDVEVTSTIIKIVDNLIIQSFFSDITERKSYERNRELLLDKLNASLEFKAKFLANVSHELRTPLNAIMGFSQLLLEQSYGKINPEQKEFMKDINSAGNHLLRIINSILDLSRIEAGKLIIHHEKLNLNKLIKKIDTIINTLYRKKGLEFIIEGITDNDYIFADSLHFKQILFNLLSNSIKFTEKGKITLRAIKKLDHWEFQIEDTGIGIAAEDYDIIFREFGRIENDRTNKTPGVGLGLALTKRMINLHGGEIWFESEYNKGTTFYFTIPNNPSSS